VICSFASKLKDTEESPRRFEIFRRCLSDFIAMPFSMSGVPPDHLGLFDVDHRCSHSADSFTVMLSQTTQLKRPGLACAILAQK
jgi:hypothetical protein